MKILILGKTGQVARRIYQNIQHIAQIAAIGSDEIDFNFPLRIREKLASYSPDMIINCAAYNKVDDAEINMLGALNINFESVKQIAEYAKENNIWLIHYSTDYVFDGKELEAYTENSTPNPLSHYGYSKLLADEFIKANLKKYVILRTSSVFDVYGINYISKLLTRAFENKVINLYENQHFKPTSALLISAVTITIISKILENKFKAGLYNLTCSDATSRYDFTDFILNYARITGLKIKAHEISLEENNNNISIRPKFSALSNDKISNELGIRLPSWKNYVEIYFDEYKLINFK